MTMKAPVISSLLFLLGVASLPAIERPKSLDEKKPKERAETRPDGAEERVLGSFVTALEAATAYARHARRERVRWGIGPKGVEGLIKT